MNNSYDEIISYLCIGSVKAMEDYPKFTLIVNCTKHIDTTSFDNVIQIPINDSPDESSHLLQLMERTQILDKIHECLIHNKPVLVHCHAGMQRSCALVACYLMKYNYMDPVAAIQFIRHKRHIAFFGSVNFQSAIDLFYLENLRKSASNSKPYEKI
jgi:protein-tyrosine phosphatase